MENYACTDLTALGSKGNETKVVEIGNRQQ
jgi:hypothetical protein